jgi:PAT family beta-lactamase induction signal transducer AmpG
VQPSSNQQSRGLSLLNPRTLPILFLGFSSGLPLALSGTTLQAWFATENVSIFTIGLLTLVGQPYAYKFLWAPFLDRFIPPFLGRRRGWMVITQISLAISIGLMAFGHPKSHGLTLALVALVVAFLSATQDISIDAYRTDILEPNERGIGSAFTSIGYRIAMITSGGLALIFADHWGWQMTYLTMAFIMLLTSSITFFSPEPEIIHSPTSLKQAIIEPLVEFLSRPEAKWFLIFLVLYKFGDAFTVSLTSAFLIKSLHFSLSVVGSINKIVGITASIVGGIAGGILLARMNLYRALLIFGIGQALCSFLFMWLAITGKNIILLAITVFADNFFSGMSAVALIVFITSLCNKKFSATQYALFTAIASLSRIFVGPLAGFSVEKIGWVNFFFISFFVSLPGLLLLWSRRNSYDAQHIKFQE